MREDDLGCTDDVPEINSTLSFKEEWLDYAMYPQGGGKPHEGNACKNHIFFNF